MRSELSLSISSLYKTHLSDLTLLYLQMTSLNSTMPEYIDMESRKENNPLRKKHKIIIEKRRRNRINNCLGELKTLLLQAMRKEHTAEFSKLEKADILEMTVKYLRSIQRQQLSVSMATDPSALNKYRAGFNECASQALYYLDQSNGPQTDILADRLRDHMQSRQDIPNVYHQKQQQQQQVSPLNLHNNARMTSPQSAVVSPQDLSLMHSSQLSMLNAQAQQQEQKYMNLKREEYSPQSVNQYRNSVSNETVSKKNLFVERNFSDKPNYEPCTPQENNAYVYPAHLIVPKQEPIWRPW